MTFVYFTDGYGNSYIVDFFSVIPEKHKFVELVDTAFSKKARDGDSDVLILGYCKNLNELFITNKREEHNNTFWNPTTKRLGNNENHTPKQTSIFSELYGMKVEEKLTHKDDGGSQNKFPERLDWTDRLLAGPEEQTVEGFQANIMTLLPASDLTLAWIPSSMLNWHQNMKKLFTSKAYQSHPVW